MNPISLNGRTNIRIGFSGSADEQQVVCPPLSNKIINTTSLFLVISGLLFFTLWNYDNLSAKFKSWLFIGSCLSWVIFGIYETYYRLEAQIQAKRAAINNLLRHTELRLHLPPSQAFAARGRLQGLRIQLAILEREFDGLDLPTARALRPDNGPTVPLMSRDEINALPVHKYMVTGHQSQTSIPQEASSSSGPKKDELICNICLEQVKSGELVRSLPCLHQFHAKCIDQWLGRRGVCPVCKLTIGSKSQQNGRNGPRGDDMV